ncbi:aminotransferase class I/II-fold pyridoxal phosphate-dependent enzyme [Microbacteriaceae bacterium 4G12]
MKQEQTPLYDALVQFAAKRPLSYHVPGHKNGTYFAERGDYYFHKLLAIDVTELTGLDDLHDPSDCIEEAQTLLAQLYGVQKSYFLVNGSTVGNLAMILAVCKENDIVLVQRNCHKSVMHALQLVGARPVFLETIYDDQAYVPVGMTCETVAQALNQYPEAKALILTHPNYYGMGMDLADIITVAHSKDIPVLVDEAHGAHFCLGEPFPKSAIAYGADVVVHSAHKTLPAMTMGSYLHVNSERVDEKTISQYLSMLQSSSPSYPIMASLDLARYSLAELKKKGLEELLSFVKAFREELSTIPQISVLHSGLQDIIKITIQTRCKLSGYEIQGILEKEGIYTELADPYNVLLILPLQVQEEYVQAVARIKTALGHYEVVPREKAALPSYSANVTVLPYNYKELELYKSKCVHLCEAKGYIAADMLIPYPPGIPLIIKGEQIADEHIKAFNLLKQSGARFQGPPHIKDGKINVYDV